MNGIFAKQSSSLTNTTPAKGQNDIETAGSLAMNNTPIFSFPVCDYDTYVSTNPFSQYSLNIDFSGYAGDGETLACNFGFMEGFANAMAVMSDFGGSASCSGAAASCCAGSCSSGGGFTSVG